MRALTRALANAINARKALVPLASRSITPTTGILPARHCGTRKRGYEVSVNGGSANKVNEK
jgi:hypothetical protein